MRWIPLLLLAATPLFAQEPASAGDEVPNSKPSPWTHKLVGDVTANQVALKDWSQGGDDSLLLGV